MCQRRFNSHLGFILSGASEEPRFMSVFGALHRCVRVGELGFVGLNLGYQPPTKYRGFQGEGSQEEIGTSLLILLGNISESRNLTTFPDLTYTRQPAEFKHISKRRKRN